MNAIPSIPELEEYASNAFIRSLPPIPTIGDILKDLTSLPIYQERERAYPASLRKHCVLRLLRTFIPMARQAVLAERIDMVLRQGYLGRNPADSQYLAHLQDGAARIERGTLDGKTDVVALSTAISLALAGCSGCGKSQTIERALHRYPQTIPHTAPFSLIQIVWIKLDCPLEGSVKQLCIAFFAEVDRIAGTNYLRTFGDSRNAREWMLLRMAQVARLHAVGLLVVDEIQNLNETKIGPQSLLTFLVMLINTIGIPVLLVGTLGAIPILQRNFRQGRRSTGIGSAIWDRMPRGPEWNAFVEKIWGYQWTRTATAMSPEIAEAIYDETQGIADIAVKLTMLCQLRAIAISEAGRHRDEQLTHGLIRRVAKEHLAIIQPMIVALRTNNAKALERFDDLAPLQLYVQDLIATELAGSASVDPMATSSDATAGRDVLMSEEVSRALIGLGVASDVAAVLVAQLRATVSDEDPLAMLEAALAQLRQSRPSATRSRSKPATKRAEPIPQAPDDLRALVAAGAARAESAYDALHKAGVIGAPNVFSAL